MKIRFIDEAGAWVEATIIRENQGWCTLSLGPGQTAIVANDRIYKLDNDKPLSKKELLKFRGECG